MDLSGPVTRQRCQDPRDRRVGGEGAQGEGRRPACGSARAGSLGVLQRLSHCLSARTPSTGEELRTRDAGTNKKDVLPVRKDCQAAGRCDGALGMIEVTRCVARTEHTEQGLVLCPPSPPRPACWSRSTAVPLGPTDDLQRADQPHPSVLRPSPGAPPRILSPFTGDFSPCIPADTPEGLQLKLPVP